MIGRSSGGRIERVYAFQGIEGLGWEFGGKALLVGDTHFVEWCCLLGKVRDRLLVLAWRLVWLSLCVCGLEGVGKVKGGRGMRNSLEALRNVLVAGSRSIIDAMAHLPLQ